MNRPVREQAAIPHEKRSPSENPAAQDDTHSAHKRSSSSDTPRVDRDIVVNAYKSPRHQRRNQMPWSAGMEMMKRESVSTYVWNVSDPDRKRYLHLYEKLTKGASVLEVRMALAFFLKSKIDTSILKDIVKLAGVDVKVRQQHILIGQFGIIMHLIRASKKGIPIPKILPGELRDFQQKRALQSHAPWLVAKQGEGASTCFTRNQGYGSTRKQGCTTMKPQNITASHREAHSSLMMLRLEDSYPSHFSNASNDDKNVFYYSFFMKASYLHQLARHFSPSGYG